MACYTNTSNNDFVDVCVYFTKVNNDCINSSASRESNSLTGNFCIRCNTVCKDYAIVCFASEVFKFSLEFVIFIKCIVVFYFWFFGGLFRGFFGGFFRGFFGGLFRGFFGGLFRGFFGGLFRGFLDRKSVV